MTTLEEPTIDILKRLIHEFEGCKLHAYKCPAGIWTIGYGHTGQDVTPSTVWTQKRCDEQLVVDMEKYWKDAKKWSPILLTASPSRRAAIIDFVYNVGAGAYHLSSLLTYVNAGDWEKASKSILKWNKAHVNGKLIELPGLTRRRFAESALLRLA